MKKININNINYTDNIYYICRTILIIGLPLTIVSGSVLSLSNISATTSGTDNLAITISSSCTLGSVVNTPHSKEVYNGNYETNIGKTTIKTLCNDGNGYAIYANGYSNNEEGNNQLINSAYPQYSIDTGLATSGLTSQWAMKLNNIENDPSPTPPVIEQNYNNIYGIVPTFWTKVASRTAGTTDMDEGSSFTTTYAVYASSNQHAGTYVGQVMYLLAHPAYPESLHFMQDVADWKDELTEVNSSLQAIDKRDGKLYWVTKLADGNIWMTQNLDFDITANTTLNSMTTDLNVAYNSITGQYAEYNDGYSVQNDIIYWAPVGTATTIDFTGTTVTDWQNSNNAPYSASKTDDTNTGHTSLGNYYNWTAAIASNNSNTLTQNNTNAENSICPKGWRLPKNNPSDFSTLGTIYNINNSTATKLLNEPFYFMWSGIVNGESLVNLNTNSRYWIGTVNADIFAYALRTGNNSYDPSGSDLYRYLGFPIRCIAR